MKLKRILPTVITCIAISIFALSQALLAPLAARIAASFGHGLGWSGFLYAAGCIPYIVAGPFAGRLLSATGRHFSVSLALGLCAGAGILLFRADQFWLVCLGLALLGAAGVFVLPAGLESLRAVTGFAPADSLALCAPVLGLGASCGALLGGLLTVHGHTWRSVYLIFSIIAAITGAVHALIPFPRLSVVRLERWQTEQRSALRMQRMYPYYFTVFLYAGLEVLATSWMAAYMIHALGYTTLIASVAVALIWICAAIARLACARLTERIAPQRLALLQCLLLLCALSLCLAVADGRLFWLAVCCIGLGLSGLWPLLFGAALDVNGGGGATMSILMLWACAGAGSISVLAGIIGSQFGMTPVMSAAVLLSIVCFMLCGRVLPRKCLAPRPRGKAAAFPAPDELPEDLDEYAAYDEPDLYSGEADLEELDEFADLDDFADLREYAVSRDFSSLTSFEASGDFASMGEFEPAEDFDGADIHEYAPAERFPGRASLMPAEEFTDLDPFEAADSFAAEDEFEPAEDFEAAEAFSPADDFAVQDMYDASMEFAIPQFDTVSEASPHTYPLPSREKRISLTSEAEELMYDTEDAEYSALTGPTEDTVYQEDTVPLDSADDTEEPIEESYFPEEEYDQP